jgi:hypothetical protein
MGRGYRSKPEPIKDFDSARRAGLAVAAPGPAHGGAARQGFSIFRVPGGARRSPRRARPGARLTAGHGKV